MVKVISLSNEAYETLKNLKSENESFSGAILKLTKKRRGDLISIFGCAKEDKEFLQGLKKAYGERKKNKLRSY